MTIARSEQPSEREPADATDTDRENVAADLPSKRDLAVRIYGNFRKARPFGEPGNKGDSVPTRALLHRGCILPIPVLRGGFLAELVQIPDPAGQCGASSLNVIKNRHRHGFGIE